LCWVDGNSNMLWPGIFIFFWNLFLKYQGVDPGEKTFKTVCKYNLLISLFPFKRGGRGPVRPPLNPPLNTTYRWLFQALVTWLGHYHIYIQLIFCMCPLSLTLLIIILQMNCVSSEFTKGKSGKQAWTFL
jgi:hypothetical protein